MADFMRKFREWAIGGEEPDDNHYYDGVEYDKYVADEREQDEPPLSVPKRKRAPEMESNIVNINNIQMKIETRHPDAMADAGEIRELVKSNVAVVVNLEGTDHKVAQRVVDYLSGVADTLDGDLQCISNRIFVVAPKNVELTGEFRKNAQADGLSYSFAGEL